MVKEREYKKGNNLLLLFIFSIMLLIYYEAQKTDGKLARVKSSFFSPEDINCLCNKGMKCFSMNTACVRLNPLH